MKYKIIDIKKNVFYLEKVEDSNDKCSGCGGCSVFKKKHKCSVFKLTFPENLQKIYKINDIVNLEPDSAKFITSIIMALFIPLIILFISIHLISIKIHNQLFSFFLSIIPVIFYYYVFKKIININPYKING